MKSSFFRTSGGVVLRGRAHHDDDRVGDTDRDDGELLGWADLPAGRGREAEGPVGCQTQPHCKNNHVTIWNWNF